ncbi:MAG: CPBP family intramembrane glutamic endopeptidase [Candidatus Nanopelagicales bacterium]
MRVKPTALVGVGIWLLYVAIVLVMQKSSGVPYTAFGDSIGNMWRGVIPSLFVGSLVMAGLAVWLGWWGPALRDRHRTRVGWALIPPVIYLIIVMGNFATTDWGNIGAEFLLVAVALGVLVGFAEEFVCRGLLLVGLRGTFHEVSAWAVTCVLFGLMHGLNILLGAPAGSTVVQIVDAAMAGSAYYILRRYFGTLVWAMALHGLWDTSIFVHDQSGGGVSLLGLLNWPAAILSVVAGFVVARRTARGPLEDYARGAGEAVPAGA